MSQFVTGQPINFDFTLTGIGRRTGTGTVYGEGRFPILGNTLTIQVEESQHYLTGELIEVRTANLRSQT